MKYKAMMMVMLIVSAGLLFAADKTTIHDFTLEDYNGSQYKLSSFSDSKAVVLIFMSTRCPVSNSYNERINKLYNLYADKGFTFFGINANKTETKKEIASHTREHGFMFPVLVDKNNTVADLLNAKVTPEVFVISPDREILYHGRIDDSQNPDNVREQELNDALTAILKNKPVPVQQTKAFGCSIKRIEVSSN